ncbi:DUF6058 family natural product biosynthesis protein [[Flexibacter] sp. ATCC 35103]|uniref:DUF6058 family natural product biosynthesis protein n=1 Tax=[Flexibacter] sp. ATCC 35103 TaxID=1937528 RepID=UPI0009CF28BE|nr:DUF6058 family natural product biosynthesis protein [[Flexibacter] sp. ATCC 35103]OMQ08504.1 hypothetical protein BXU01_21360 [[Flexibacter] sp. ATCC 35103]
MENLKYIEDNYIEIQDVIKIANISLEKLNELIESKLVPEPSYIVNSETIITSSLDDSHKIVFTKKYFHPVILELIREHSEYKTPEDFKKQFKENLLSNLKNHTQKTFAYGNVFDENNIVETQKIDSALEEEWTYFCKGVYGICTLNNNENDIIEKEIAIKRILNFIENKSSLNSDDKNKLQELNDEFNKSTSNFAPYQRELSSRGKYLDKLLKEFDLEDLIKKYY